MNRQKNLGWMGLICLCWPMLTWAEQWVDIECLAFRYHTDKDSLAEHLPPSAPLIPTRSASILPAGQHYTAIYHRRPSAEFRLNDSHRHLSQSNHATVIFHQRWRQPLTPKASINTLLVKINDAHPFYQSQFPSLRAAYFPERGHHALKYTPNPVAHLTDDNALSQLQLQVHSGRYHDVHLNFYDGQYGPPMRLSGTQKLSNNQTFYFDHPLLGVVIQVSTVR